MPKAKINGINLYYEVFGGGYPLVFLHGFTATSAMWKPQLPALSQNYKVVIYDARGHGQSESPTSASEYSIELVVEDLSQLLAWLQIEKAVIAGLSMGGYVSLNFCFTHPEKVRALILAGTGPGYRSQAKRQQWNDIIATVTEALETHGLLALNDAKIASLIGRPVDKEIAKTFRHTSPQGLINTARTVLYNPGVIDKLSGIKVPTLIIAGKHDTSFIEAAAYMNTAIYDSKKVIIPGAGHMVNIDQSEVFNSSILEFLKVSRITK